MASSRPGASLRSTADPSTAPPAVQQVVSLALVLHLFCVFLALSSYTRRSPLQSRVLGLLAPYTRTLALAPSVAPYHLTQYDALTGDHPEDDENYLELEVVGPDGEPEFHDLGAFALDFPDARRRYRTLASEMVYSLAPDAVSENRLNELARAAAAYGLRRLGATEGVLRLRRHMSQPRSLAHKAPGGS